MPVNNGSIALKARKIAQDNNPKAQVTILLKEWQRGKRESLEKVIALVYSDLRQKAEYFLNMEAENHILQPTALISEAVLQIMEIKQSHFKNRAMFFGLMGQIMRHVLVKYARDKQAVKRGSGEPPKPLEEGMAHLGRNLNLPEVLSIHQALSQLEAVDARKCRIVELRFFAGLNIKETSEALNLSQTTVKSEWHVARRWLAARLDQQRFDKLQ